ncbi:hypothetical protein, partial [Pseudomonas moorei]|uniref:hypothetical protein n=1 Tax=Pseudomonas moorei TaxID=395599 RepID=UPI00200E0C6E
TGCFFVACDLATLERIAVVLSLLDRGLNQRQQGPLDCPVATEPVQCLCRRISAKRDRPECQYQLLFTHSSSLFLAMAGYERLAAVSTVLLIFYAPFQGRVF